MTARISWILMRERPSSIKDRFIREAAALRLRLQSLPPGKNRDHLLRNARQFEAAANIAAWIESPGLQPPK
jgi:hypothetical protein